MLEIFRRSTGRYVFLVFCFWCWNFPETKSEGDFTLYEYKSHSCRRFWGGACERFQVPDGGCINFNFYAKKVSSIELHSECITIWEDRDCTGEMLHLTKSNENAACLEDLSLCDYYTFNSTWDNKLSSVSACERDETIKFEYDSRFVIWANEDRSMQPFQTNASFNHIQELHGGGISFHLPTKLKLECYDGRWNLNRMNTTIAEIEASGTCLEILFREGNQTKENDETWTIGTSRVGCLLKLPIENCIVVPHSQAASGTIQSQTIFGNMLDLDDIPEAYAIEDIRPSLYVHVKDKPVQEISFTNSWRRPLFGDRIGLDGNTIANISTVIFICPGFKNSNNEIWVDEMKSKILGLPRGSDIMVITVGWERGGNLWFWQYTRAVANTQIVGEYLGNIVRQLKSDMPHVLIWGIGYSLGAHVMGKAGRVSGLFDRITGLDPAGPSFETAYLNNRLTKKDAKFVDAIHTDGLWGAFTTKPGKVRNTDFYNPVGHYGTLLSSGHLDFYPNWGYQQPFWWDLLGPSFYFNPFGILSHQRSHELFTWSVSNPDKFVTSVRILGQPSLEAPPTKSERSEMIVEMGFHASPTLEGNFYLLTSSQAPWVEPPRKQIGTEEFSCHGKYPRVMTTNIGTGMHRKIQVYSNVNTNGWERVYTVYWNTRDRTSPLTIHKIRTTVIDDVEAKGSHSFTSTLCSHVKSGASQALEDVFGGIHPTISNAYSEEEQDNSMELQGIPIVNGNYFEKGHMVPNADFDAINDNQRKATYLYINAAPQRKLVNKGNWKKLETFLRQMARTVDFTVFTLPLNHHQNNRGQSIALAKHSEGGSQWNRIYVPQKFAKVIIGRVNNEGMCADTYVVDNDPQLTDHHHLEDCGDILAEKIRGTNIARGRLQCFPGITQDIVDAIDGVVEPAVLKQLFVAKNYGPCFNRHD